MFFRTFLFSTFVLVLVSVAPVYPRPGLSFDKIFDIIDSESPSSEVGLRAKLHGDSVIFFKPVETSVSKSQFDQAQKIIFSVGDAGTHVARIQFALQERGFYIGTIDSSFGSDTKRAVEMLQKSEGFSIDGKVGEKTWRSLFPTEDQPTALLSGIDMLPDNNFRFEFYVNELTSLKETYLNNEPSEWRQVRWLPILGISEIEWPIFVDSALRHGLTDYSEYTTDKNSFGFLTFKQSSPKSLSFANRVLRFNPEFYDYMRFSADFPPRSGQRFNSFIILIHDPHFSVGGVIQLLHGLGSLLKANPDFEPVFLVEGAFESPWQHIPLDPLQKCFSSSTASTTQIYAMLSRFLIDCPLAYRLLAGQNIPAIAIDDNDAIKMTPDRPRMLSDDPVLQVIRTTYSKLDQHPSSSTKKSATENLAFLSLYVRSDPSELKGEEYLAYFATLDTVASEVAYQLTKLSRSQYVEEVAILNSYATSCNQYVKHMQPAFRRDTVMTMNIVGQLSQDPERVPFVFIGNFHTHGILNVLPQNLGYVVIEPRQQGLLDSTDHDLFNLAIHNRSDYFEQIMSHIKQPTYPRKTELPAYRNFLLKTAEQVASSDSKFLSTCEFSPSVGEKVLSSVRSNPIMATAAIYAVGGGTRSPPPSDYSRAFASFSFGPERLKPELTVFDPSDAGWNRGDRARYLKAVVFNTPSSRGDDTRIRQATFSVDDVTKRLFAALYDSATKSYYLFENPSLQDIQSLLHAPRKSSKLKVWMHMIIGEQDDPMPDLSNG